MSASLRIMRPLRKGELKFFFPMAYTFPHSLTGPQKSHDQVLRDPGSADSPGPGSLPPMSDFLQFLSGSVLFLPLLPTSLTPYRSGPGPLSEQGWGPPSLPPGYPVLPQDTLLIWPCSQGPGPGTTAGWGLGISGSLRSAAQETTARAPRRGAGCKTNAFRRPLAPGQGRARDTF